MQRPGEMDKIFFQRKKKGETGNIRDLFYFILGLGRTRSIEKKEIIRN